MDFCLFNFSIDNGYLERRNGLGYLLSLPGSKIKPRHTLLCGASFSFVSVVPVLLTLDLIPRGFLLCGEGT
jgi:hypothetical protein